MNSRFIVCLFNLWIDYGVGTCRLAQVAVFHFNRQISNREVCQRMKRVGFKPADERCLFTAYQVREVFPIVGSQGIIASATKFVIAGAVKSPFINKSNDKVFIDYVYRSKEDWSGYWQSHWKFLGVKWLDKAQSYEFPFRRLFHYLERRDELEEK